MARVALSVAIVNAYITQGQIVGPTQVVSNGTDVATAGTTAQTDMATLSADIATAVATANTVKAEAICPGHLLATAYNDATRAPGRQLQRRERRQRCVDLSGSTTTMLATGTDINTMATMATYGLTTLLNNQTYTAGTKQLSGTPGSSVTLTVTQQESFIANFNAIGAASWPRYSRRARSSPARIRRSATAEPQLPGRDAVLDVDTVSNFISGTIQPAANTLSTNGTTIVNNVSACSTAGTVVTNDIGSLLGTGINGQMYVVYDPAYVSDVAILVQELNAVLNYLQTNGSIT